MGRPSRQNARTAPLRGRPRALQLLALRRVVCPAAVAAAPVLVAEGLAAKDAALPVRRAAARRAARHLGRLARRGEVAGDACGFGDHREQSHAPRAPGAGQDVHRERARQKLRPRAVSSGVARWRRLSGRRRRLRVRLRRDARSPPARRREDTRVLHGMEPRWGHAGRQPAQQRQRVHVDGDRSKVMRTRPSGRRSRRSCATGGRST